MITLEAIVYTSNSGFTAAYARLLGEKTGLPVFSLAESNEKVRAGAKIIYLGWLMAGNIKGYRKAKKRYSVCCCVGVGMAKSGSQIDDMQKANKIGDDEALFCLQGGFDINKLRGIYRFMMKTMARGVNKKLAEKENKTPDEMDMLDLMQNGGSRVSEENLAPVLAWYKQQSE